MGNFIRLVVTLTLIAAVASFGLSAVYNATHEIAEDYKAQEEESARREVLPDAEGIVFERTETDSVLANHPFVYYTATAPAADGGAEGGERELVGYTFKAYGPGYSSTIETIVGVDPSGTVQGIKIVFQQETPGLGAKVEEVASENTLWDVMSGDAVDETGARPWFQAQFAGKRPEDLVVVKSREEEGILAITGATISSTAVTESVRRGLEMLTGFVGGPGAGSAGGEGVGDAGDEGAGGESAGAAGDAETDGDAGGGPGTEEGAR